MSKKYSKDNIYFYNGSIVTSGYSGTQYCGIAYGTPETIFNIVKEIILDFYKETLIDKEVANDATVFISALNRL